MDQKELDEVIREFLIESHENLDQIDQDLVVLEKNPSRREVFDKIFRTLHTIKGSCGFLGYSKLESIAHAGESLLESLRAGEIGLNSEITSALLTVMDAVRNILRNIETNRVEGEEDYSDLVSNLFRLQQESPSSEERVAQAEHQIPVAEKPAAQADRQTLYDRIGGREPIVEAVEGLYRRILADSELQGFFSSVDLNVLKAQQVLFLCQALGGPAEYRGPDMKTVHAHLRLGRRHFERVVACLIQTFQSLKVPQTIIDEVAALLAPLADEIVSHAPEKTGRESVPETPAVPSERSEESTGSSAVSDSTIRVEVDLLDKLMTLVGEMVLARNQILQYASGKDDPVFLATVQRLNMITSELQEAAMKTRMQPIGNIWSRFPRMVRDLAIACGKQVRLQMEGRDTDLDKSIIEAIRDPLTHLVRNAVDHGIEKPEARAEAGKSMEGIIHLRAYHEGGNVNIEISDDGAGIDPERVRQKAIQRALITPQQAESMSDQQLMNLIFLPGFSLAENVTNVSGRGVGMDVVRSKLEKVSGTVDVQSELGRNTVIKIKIPLTLAIIPALLVRCGQNNYAIPQVSLLELVRLKGEGKGREIEQVHGAPVYRLRGNLLPLVFLDRVLRKKGEIEHRAGKAGETEENAVNIVVLQAEDRIFGLVVEGINDTEEIVVKPLGRRLKGIACFSGAAILGDGRVALILDVPGLARNAKVVSESKEQKTVLGRAVVQEKSTDKTTLLLFSVGKGRMGIPLSMVARLEEFEPSKIERTGNQEVVQYRGEIMPLIRLTDVL
ncbi:MAG TPA: chemotaxis protein CheA, partial [Nitrospiria bacterium]|nr:chemotaxis protein CheA [Nitrospiria bacterium]